MIRMAISDLEPGFKIARNVYHSDGQLLLAQGVLLTHRYIQRLYDLQTPFVYVDNPFVEFVELPEAIKEETRLKTTNLIEQSFRKVQQVQKINPAMIQSIAKIILEDLETCPTALIHLTELRLQSETTFCHSVNVAVFSVLFCKTLNYASKNIAEVIMGALLHDIGKMLLTRDSNKTTGQLTSEADESGREHAELGFYFLRKNGTGIPLLSLHGVYQHHECFDGSGYPRGIKGQEIHEYARIIAIADAYDNLLTEKPGSPALLPHEAYEALMCGSGTKYDPQLLGQFLKHLVLYPTGTYVKLNTGQIGLVVKVLPGLPTRPVVKILSPGPLQGQEVGLQNHLTVFVEEVLRGKDILAFHRS